MRVLIDSRSLCSLSIHNALVQIGVQSFIWDNQQHSVIEVYDELKQEIIIINENCNASQRNTLKTLEPNVQFIFIGLWNETFPTPIVCLGSEEYEQFPTIFVEGSVFDTNYINKGLFDAKTCCEISVFTDKLDNEVVNKNIEIINLLINKKARFFGNVSLPTVNYLGSLDRDMRSKIIASSDVCVDVSGSDWKSIALSGGVVLSKDCPVEEFSFSDVAELGDKIDLFLESRPNTSALKFAAIKGSGIDLCIDIFRLIKLQEIVDRLFSLRQGLLQ